MKGQIISALILGGLLIIFLGALFAPTNSSCQSWNCLKYIPDNIVDFENNMPTYGEMYICPTPTTLDLSVSNTWYNLTTEWIYGERNNVSNLTAYDLLIEKTGVYQFTYSATFNAAQKDKIIATLVDGGSLCVGCQAAVTIAVGGNEANLANTCLYTINSTNRPIYLQFYDDGGTTTLNVDKVTVTVKRIGVIP